MTDRLRPMREMVLWSNPAKDKDMTLYFRVRELLGLNGVRVRAPLSYQERIPGGADVFLPPDELFCSADAAIVLGGDGTILQAAAGAIAADCPILGVNLGRVGYMADVGKEELPLLSRLFAGDAVVSERMTFEVSIEKNGERRVVCPYALNDAVLVSGRPAEVVGIRVTSNGAEVARHRGDGVIVATPTGSTAYSMSAGGPVLDPTLECMSVTPICSTSPAARAIVFSGDGEIGLYAEDEGKVLYLTCDGTEGIYLDAGTRVIIRKGAKKAKLISLKDDAFFHVLRKKMMSAI